MIDLIKQRLSEEGITILRESITGDGSTFLTLARSGIDIYPDDNVVVLILRGDITNYHELSYEEFEDGLKILKKFLRNYKLVIH